ncbi:F9K20.17 [Arabidopsis thaliana]|nr:F9K20.17 [Arabidopsis thaliana]
MGWAYYFTKFYFYTLSFNSCLFFLLQSSSSKLHSSLPSNPSSELVVAASLYIVAVVVSTSQGSFVRCGKRHGREQYLRFCNLFSQRERSDAIDATEAEVALGTTKKNRLASEAVQRAAIIAEAEGMEKIEATHLERILPQLLLDF